MPAYDYNSIGVGVQAVQNMFKQKEEQPKQPKQQKVNSNIFEQQQVQQPQQTQGEFDKLLSRPSAKEVPVDRPTIDPDNFDLIQPDQVENFPEGSEVRNILSKGNSLIFNPKDGNVVGVRTKNGGALSMQEALKGVDPEDLLIKHGYHDTPDNVQKFIDNNSDLSLDPRKLDFTGLKPSSDKEVVKDKLSEVTWGIINAPLKLLLEGGKHALSYLSEGLQRYEALKASVLDPTTVLNPMKRLKEIGGSLFGATPTEFPDAKLRTGEYKELGDIYRKMGFPDWFAATAGFALDVTSDFGIGFGAPKAAKVLGKVEIPDEIFKKAGIKKPVQEGAEAATKATVGDVFRPTAEAAREQFLKFRSNEFVKEIEGALTGLSRFDIKSAPMLKPVMRKLMGETNYKAQLAKDHAHQIQNFIATRVAKEASPELGEKVGLSLQNQIHEALTEKGTTEALSKLPLELQTMVNSSRQVIDDLSGELIPLLKKIIEDPSASLTRNELRKKAVAARFGVKIVDGKEIPVDELVKIIADNQGSYIKRGYKIFHDGYKPTQEVIDNAVKGLMDEFPAEYATKELAQQEVDRILSSKAGDRVIRLKDVVNGDRELNTSSFIARQKIPVYLRELMGEIKDPAHNIVETTRSLAETVQNLKLFESLKSMGAVIPEDQFVKGFDQVIKTQGKSPLHWASIEGMKTTPEVGAFLKGMQKQEDALSDIFLKSSIGLKFAKTVLNPKSHMHNLMGNSFVFSTLAGISPFDPSNFKHFKESAQILEDVKLMQAGKLPFDHPSAIKFREMVKEGVVGTELPVADNISFVENLLKNPFGLRQDNEIIKGAKAFAKKSAELYAMEDQIFKMASYLKYTKSGMKPADAVSELYKWFPNYAEASKLAEHARTSTGGVLFLSPFLTVRSEAHRIMLNAFKESPYHRAMMGGMMGGRFAWNTAMLSLAGNGLDDIKEFYMTEPERVAEKMLNPFSKEFDVNLKYIDPLNTSGLFAPLMAYAGATGVSPFDYLLDFTNFSPEFGYSNLYVNAVEGAISGKGRYGQDLTAQERLQSVVTGVLGSSYTSDLPRILNKNEDPTERARRVLRFAGIDVEKRDARWIRSKASARLAQRLEEGVNVEPTLRAIEELGFDSERMLKQIVRKKKSVYKSKPDPKKQSNIDRALSILEQENRE